MADEDRVSPRTSAISRKTRSVAILWWEEYWKVVDRIATQQELWSSLQTIDMMFSPAPDLLLKSGWAPQTLKSVFGDDTVIVIDLHDEKEITRLKEKLEKDPGCKGYLRDLRVARSVVDLTDRRGNVWDVSYRESLYYWLKGQCNRENRDPSFIEERFHRGHDIGTWDLEHPWIQSTLAKMPKLRPVFLLARKDDTWTGPRKDVPLWVQ